MWKPYKSIFRGNWDTPNLGGLYLDRWRLPRLNYRHRSRGVDTAKMNVYFNDSLPVSQTARSGGGETLSRPFRLFSQQFCNELLGLNLQFFMVIGHQTPSNCSQRAGKNGKVPWSFGT